MATDTRVLGDYMFQVEHGLRIAQFISLTLAIIVFFMKLKIMKYSKTKHQIPWLVWLGNFILFYVLYLLDGTFHYGIRQLLENPDFFIVWSGMLRLHLLGVLFSYTFTEKPFYKGGKQ